MNILNAKVTDDINKIVALAESIETQMALLCPTDEGMIRIVNRIEYLNEILIEVADTAIQHIDEIGADTNKTEV